MMNIAHWVCVLAICWLHLVRPSWAQCTAPTASGYTACPASVSANGYGGLTNWGGTYDDSVITLNLPFAFPWGATSYSQIVLSSNGFIVFGSSAGSGCCSAPGVPSSSWGPFISAYWADLYSVSALWYGPGSGVYAGTYVIHGENVGHCCSNAGPSTFEIILYPSGVAITNCINCGGSGWTHMMGFQVSGTEGAAVWTGGAYTGAWRYSRCPTSNGYLICSTPTPPENGLSGLANWGSTVDDQTFITNLPFSFPWGGSSYSTISISSNGFVMFGSSSSSGCCSAPAFPSASYPPLIAAYWSDLYSIGGIYYGGGSGVYSGAYVIRFQSVYHCCSSGSNPATFEIILYSSGTALVNCINCGNSASWTHSMAVQFTPSTAYTIWTGTTLIAAYTVIPTGPAPPPPNPCLTETVPPVITLNGNNPMVIECGSGFSDPGASANDACDGSRPVSVSGSVGANSPGSYVLTYTASDTKSNTASSTRTVIVQDTTAPTITVAATSPTYECTGNTANTDSWYSSFGGASASDACTTPSWSSTQSRTNTCGNTYYIDATFTATAGGSTSTSGRATVRDTTAPTFTTNPASATFECSATSSTSVSSWVSSLGGAAASETCSSITWSNNYGGLSSGCGAAGTGSATVTFSATDGCGNVRTAAATVTVQDTTNPTFSTAPASSTIECSTAAARDSALSSWLANTAGGRGADTCSAATVSYTYSTPASLTASCAGTGNTGAVVFTARDACGRTTTASATFTVRDTTPPTIPAPSALSLQCSATQGTTITAWLNDRGNGGAGSDSCAITTTALTWSNNYAGLTGGCSSNTGTATVTFTARDSCSNAATTTGTITVTDTTAPTFTTDPSPLVIDCSNAATQTAQINSWLTSNGGAVATDTCSTVTFTNNYVATPASLSASCGGTGSTSVIFTARDACGNTATRVTSITVRDVTAPTIPQALGLSLECSTATQGAAISSWLSLRGNGGAGTDSCSTSAVTWLNNYVALTGGCGAAGSALVTFTARDSCSNQATTQATVTVSDTTAPTFTTRPSNLTIECSTATAHATAISSWLSATSAGTDACSTVTILNSYPGSPPASQTASCGGTGYADVTFTVRDACLLSSTASARATIRDTVPPVITAGSALNLACSATSAAAVTSWVGSRGGATAADGCATSTVSWASNYTALLNGCSPGTGSAQVAFTATDSCGNAATTVNTVTVTDTTAPAFTTAPQSTTLECSASTNAARVTAWVNSVGNVGVASDACSLVTITNNYAGTPPAVCGGSLSVTFTAKDQCLNAVTQAATVTIVDTTAPVITTQASNLTVECNATSGSHTNAVNNWLSAHGGAVASDACSGTTITWTHDFTSLSDQCGQTGTATVTFTATDTCGRSSITRATATVIDTSSPIVVTQPQSLIVDCDANTANTQTSRVNAWLSSYANHTAFDSCSPLTYQVVGSTALSATCSGSTGNATVAFRSVDECNNTGVSYSASVSVVDRLAPVLLTSPVSTTIQCGASQTTAVQAWLTQRANMTVQDACATAAELTWSNNYTALTPSCGNTGAAQVAFTARDPCGNVRSSAATVTVVDTLPPTITLLPSDITVECDVQIGALSAINDWLTLHGGATATDQCLGAGAITWSHNFTASPSVCGGTTRVGFTARDPCGNQVVATALLRVSDTKAPAVTQAASNLIIECSPTQNTTIATWLTGHASSQAQDNCTAVASLTWTNNYVGISDLCGNTGSAAVTFTVADICSNTATSSATVTVRDTTAPVISTPASNANIQCDALAPSGGSVQNSRVQAWLAAHGNAAGTDACSSLTWQHNFGSLSTLCGATGAATVTFTATDACALSSTTTATVSIVDNTPPVVTTAPSNPTSECDAQLAASTQRSLVASWVAGNAGAVAFDNCSAITISNNFSAPASYQATCGGAESAAVQFSFTDGCNNVAARTATYRVVDTTAPTVTTQPSALALECNAQTQDADIATWLSDNAGQTAVDSCAATTTLTWSNNYTQLTTVCGGSGAARVGFAVTDPCGNAAYTTSQVLVTDSTAPQLTGEAKNYTLECDAQSRTSQQTALIASWLGRNADASAQDSCSAVAFTNNYVALTAQCGSTGVALVTFTATDACNLTTTTAAIVTVIDTQPPEMTQPASVVYECDAAASNAQESSRLAWLNSRGSSQTSDLCSAPALVVLTNNFTTVGVEPQCGDTSSVTVEFAATDACGLQTAMTATYTIVDTLPPAIVSPAADLTIECDRNNGGSQDQQVQTWLSNNGGAQAEDNCTETTKLVWTSSGDVFNLCGNGTTTRTVVFVVTDECGHSSNTTATVSVVDTTEPVIVQSVSSVSNLECNRANQNTSILQWLNSHGTTGAAHDACTADEDLVWTYTYSGLLNGCVRGVTGTGSAVFKVTDQCGHNSTQTGTITVMDTTAPTITVSATDYVAECDGGNNTVEFNAFLARYGGAQASDVCSSRLSWSHNYDQYASQFQYLCGLTGNITVNFTVTDECNQASSTAAVFTIVDSKAPNITLRGPARQVAQAGTPWTDYGADVVDQCFGNLNADLIVTSPNMTALRTTNATYSITDNCGNLYRVVRSVTVVDDIPPVLVLNGPTTLSLVLNTPWFEPGYGVTDTFDPNPRVRVTWNPDYAATAASGGTTVGTYTATDMGGNTATATRTVFFSGSSSLAGSMTVSMDLSQVVPVASPLSPYASSQPATGVAATVVYRGAFTAEVVVVRLRTAVASIRNVVCSTPVTIEAQTSVFTFCTFEADAVTGAMVAKIRAIRSVLGVSRTSAVNTFAAAMNVSSLPLGSTTYLRDQLTQFGLTSYTSDCATKVCYISSTTSTRVLSSRALSFFLGSAPSQSDDALTYVSLDLVHTSFSNAEAFDAIVSAGIVPIGFTCGSNVACTFAAKLWDTTRSTQLQDLATTLATTPSVKPVLRPRVSVTFAQAQSQTERLAALVQMGVYTPDITCVAGVCTFVTTSNVYYGTFGDVTVTNIVFDDVAGLPSAQETLYAGTVLLNSVPTTTAAPTTTTTATTTTETTTTETTTTTTTIEETSTAGNGDTTTITTTTTATTTTAAAAAATTTAAGSLTVDAASAQAAISAILGSTGSVVCSQSAQSCNITTTVVLTTLQLTQIKQAANAIAAPIMVDISFASMFSSSIASSLAAVTNQPLSRFTVTLDPSSLPVSNSSSSSSSSSSSGNTNRRRRGASNAAPASGALVYKVAISPATATPVYNVFVDQVDKSTLDALDTRVQRVSSALTAAQVPVRALNGTAITYSLHLTTTQNLGDPAQNATFYSTVDSVGYQVLTVQLANAQLSGPAVGSAVVAATNSSQLAFTWNGFAWLPANVVDQSVPASSDPGKSDPSTSSSGSSASLGLFAGAAGGGILLILLIVLVVVVVRRRKSKGAAANKRDSARNEFVNPLYGVTTTSRTGTLVSSSSHGAGGPSGEVSNKMNPMFEEYAEDPHGHDAYDEVNFMQEGGGGGGSAYGWQQQDQNSNYLASPTADTGDYLENDEHIYDNDAGSSNLYDKRPVNFSDPVASEYLDTAPADVYEKPDDPLYDMAARQTAEVSSAGGANPLFNEDFEGDEYERVDNDNDEERKDNGYLETLPSDD